MLCPFCKGEIPDDAKKCMNCGEWLDPAYRSPRREDNQGCFSFLWETFLNLAWFIFLIAIAVVAVLLYMDWHGMLGS